MSSIIHANVQYDMRLYLSDPFELFAFTPSPVRRAMISMPREHGDELWGWLDQWGASHVIVRTSGDRIAVSMLIDAY